MIITKSHMKKLLAALLILVSAGTLLPVSKVSAATTVYVSPSSKTISNGDNVTLLVKISSGSDQFSTAEARINFNSSILQFVSYSGGAMNEAAHSSSSGSFKYSGFVIAPLLSGTVTLYSVTLKAIASGTSSISLSEVLVLNGGTTLANSGSGGTVTVNSSSGSGGGSGGSTTKKPTTSTPSTTGDTTAPSLSGEPNFEKAQSTITMKFTTNEAATAKLTYYREGVDKKTMEATEAKTDHEFVIGKDDPLTAGFVYKIELVLTDAAGNSSSTLAWDVRTQGVQYKIRIVDLNGKPIGNKPVKLFSDPVSATTDSDGNVTFEDIPVGEHTLAIEIEGVTLNKIVNVVAPTDITLASSGFETISMPFALAGSDELVKQTNWLPWLFISFAAGMAIMRLPIIPLINKILSRRKAKTPSAPSISA